MCFILKSTLNLMKKSTKISIKTRIGKDCPEEFNELLDIFNKYPLEELIIHPRVQQDFYKNVPNREVFIEAFKSSKNPVCYNGDIFNVNDYNKLKEECPELNSIMLGRGLLANPGLISEIKENKIADKDMLKSLHAEVYMGYKSILSGDKNVLFKMKEFWFYMINMFADNEKYAKKIRKVKSAKEYEAIICAMYNELEIEKSNDIRGMKKVY